MRLKWMLVSVHLEIELILMQDRCTVCAERTIISEIIWIHPMDLLGDIGHVESHFNPFGDSVRVSARHVHSLQQTYHRFRNHLGRAQWYSKVTRLLWMLVSVHLEIMLILTQCRCKVCAERTIGSEINLDTPDGSRR
jgi:hypothetical protein